MSAATAEQVTRRETAVQQARRMWDAGVPVPTNDESGGHEYLRRKMVEPHGLRQLGGMLLVPMRDGDGGLWNLQKIDAKGKKRFLPGGRVKGLHHIISGDLPGIGLCEGYGTAAAIHKLTGKTVFVAFTAGNLPLVAPFARAAGDLTIYADDDRRTRGNPGRTKAFEAARAVGAKVSLPDFDQFDHERRDATDWADYLAMIEGDS